MSKKAKKSIVLFFLTAASFLPAPLRQKSAYALPAAARISRAASPAGASASPEAELFAAEPAGLTRFGLIFHLLGARPLCRAAIQAWHGFSRFFSQYSFFQISLRRVGLYPAWRFCAPPSRQGLFSCRWMQGLVCPAFRQFVFHLNNLQQKGDLLCL